MAASEPAVCIKARANACMRARFQAGRLKSLKAVKQKAVEFISPEAPFGDVTATVEAGGETLALSTVDMTPGENGDWAVFAFQKVCISTSFQLQGEKLSFSLEVKNTGDQAADIRDLAVFFPMNSRFSWGVKGSERVIRHSFVSGDGSFLYFTPCDGEPPFLVCCPQDGTRLEMYDARVEIAGQPVYRAYLHAIGEEKSAKEKGCTWRQPVSGITLQPGEAVLYGFDFLFAEGYDGIREALYEAGKPDIIIAPGMTVQKGLPVRMRVRASEKITEVYAEHPNETKIKRIRFEDNVSLYEIVFSHLGESKLTLSYGKGKYCVLEFFVTLPIERLIQLRGSFIASRQVRDESKWYNGLLAEWNNETGALLSPDNYDLIKGWRIYEVTCDDPGLSKPAFLSCKNAEYPVKEEVEALEYYIARFVWGGLQRKDSEEFPFGIYGIPDWKTLRDSDDPGPRGRAHLWRIYDYPHLGLVYLNLYRIGKACPAMLSYETPLAYLKRAYGTFLALYQYPPEIDDWSPYKTGLYNELVMTDVMDALEAEGLREAAMRLRFHWQRKAKFFITACDDVFGSEYPFDTTGYESTRALAEWGMRNGAAGFAEDQRHAPDYVIDQAAVFDAYQTQCNVACRGVMENAYYLLGSDYRGCSAHYTLSYMSQMGGWALLRYALYTAEDPFPLLRLAYASLLSSWALVNAGEEEGYWFPGREHNGAAGGGFENAPYGETWLNQPHHRGSWYYSCEIDLGFCGGLRGAAVILAEDPELGDILYGGVFENGAIVPRDGVHRRFSLVKKSMRLHIELTNARFSGVVLEKGVCRVTLCEIAQGARAEMMISGGVTGFSAALDGGPDQQYDGGSAKIDLNSLAKSLMIAYDGIND